jgi:hypothetical protein
VAEVDYHLSEAMLAVKDHLLNCLYQLDFLVPGIVGSEVVVLVAVGSRAVVVFGAAYCHLTPNWDVIHRCSVWYLYHLLLLLPNPLFYPFRMG